MKLITLNTWGGRVADPLLRFVREKSIATDIFTFQEVFDRSTYEQKSIESGIINKDLFGDFAKLLPEHTGIFLPVEEEHSGLAVFISSRYQILDKGEVLVFENPDFEDWNGESDHNRKLQWLIISLNGKKVLVMNLHGHWIPGKKVDSEGSLAQSKAIIDFINQHTGPMILAGDFNLDPDTESIRMIERVGMRNLVKEYGVTYTRTPHYKGKNAFADYVFVSEGIKVKDFKVLPDDVSDHAPLFLDFEVV